MHMYTILRYIWMFAVLILERNNTVVYMECVWTYSYTDTEGLSVASIDIK